MEVGKWYRVIDISDPPHTPIAIGDYWQFEKDDGSSMPCFRSTKNIGHYLKKSRFDPTPHTRTTFPNMPNLIERVSKIDPAAAEWLEFGDHSNPELDFGNTRDFLGGLFAWGYSPQGFMYWNNISERLNEFKRSAPMQKEYEYEATGNSMTVGGIAEHNPCDIELGKFVKWYMRSKCVEDSDIVSQLVSEQRFSWLNWLSENTPFVKRTEKKAFRFTPDTIRLAFSEDGMVNSALEIKGTDGRWWTVLTFCRDGNIYYALYCKNLPVQMDGDKIAIK